MTMRICVSPIAIARAPCSLALLDAARVWRTSNTLRSAQVRRISWVRGVGWSAVAGVASFNALSTGHLN